MATSSTAVFEVGQHFQLALLSQIIYAFEMIIIGFFVPGLVRGKVFTKQFLRENFSSEHMAATGQPVENTEGYPDIGHGRFADRLPYKDWLRFATAQRTHYNFLEQQAPQSMFIIVGALKYPVFSSVLGFVLVFARILYTYGYMQPNGSKNPIRSIGAILGDLATLIGFILACIACISAY